MNAYLSLVNRQQHITNSHCMPTSFFDFLYNPSGALRYLEAERVHYDQAKQITLIYFHCITGRCRSFLEAGHRDIGLFSMQTLQLEKSVTTTPWDVGARMTPTLSVNFSKRSGAGNNLVPHRYGRATGLMPQSRIKEQQTAVRYTRYCLLRLLIITYPSRHHILG